MMGRIGRAVAALTVASAVAVALRIRGTGGTPPRKGGWKELTEDDLASS